MTTISTLISLKYSLCCLASLFISQHCLSIERSGVGILVGEHKIKGVRFALQPLEDMQLETPLKPLRINWEISLNYWDETTFNDKNWAVSVSPVMSSGLITTPLGIDVNLEFAIGLSLHSNQHFGETNLGSKILFEDRVSLTFYLNKQKDHQLTVSVIHYSNAGLSSHNPGINLISLVYHFDL